MIPKSVDSVIMHKIMKLNQRLKINAGKLINIKNGQVKIEETKPITMRHEKMIRPAARLENNNPIYEKRRRRKKCGYQYKFHDHF